MAYKEKDTIKVKTHVQSTHNKKTTRRQPHSLYEIVALYGIATTLNKVIIA